MEIGITTSNGERCRNERHRFRVGVDDRDTTEFSANESEFCEALTNAIVEHGVSKRIGWNAGYLRLQVWTEAAHPWYNCPNPRTGGVVAVTRSIACQPETAATLFLWCCNAVQMAREINVLERYLAAEAS
jgi:hypothetical protein